MGLVSTELAQSDPTILTKVRVSDKEREQAKKKIRQAMRKGRIDEDEFLARLNACDIAKHKGNLDYLHADLPPLKKWSEVDKTWWKFGLFILAVLFVTGAIVGVIHALSAGILAGALMGTIGVVGVLAAIFTFVSWVNWWEQLKKK